MGNARYEVYRNGEMIEAGYDVETVCEKGGCEEQIDRGLGFLCGQTPGGDEYGCGGYFCGEHMTVDQQCETCSGKSAAENSWTNPATGVVYDLRDDYLPPGDAFKPDGWVWKHLGSFHGDVPVLVPVKLPGHTPGAHSGCVITAYDFEDVASVAWRQRVAVKAGERDDD